MLKTLNAHFQWKVMRIFIIIAIRILNICCQGDQYRENFIFVNYHKLVMLICSLICAQQSTMYIHMHILILWNIFIRQCQFIRQVQVCIFYYLLLIVRNRYVFFYVYQLIVRVIVRTYGYVNLCLFVFKQTASCTVNKIQNYLFFRVYGIYIKNIYCTLSQICKIQANCSYKFQVLGNVFVNIYLYEKIF
eukprot:TRINITY_DN5526_c1_g1_i3.p1 TRINITY_DN5526_c1_g1~~TRINITY_DN5526_c1_g1_i3.p1  ORF type:complete len:200 (-),score=-21.28 TRINITY_DN5526_c1_g1_i3:3-572(-)